jgi:hypothetical protein
MLVDLGAGLGALAGASAASPLVFKDETAAKTRLFVGSVLGGTFLGGTLAWLFTREKPVEHARPRAARMMPILGPLGSGPISGYVAGLAGVF